MGASAPPHRAHTHTRVRGWCARRAPAGKHPNAGEGLWGSGEEAPSFLYAMPLGGNRVFLEETCLVAKPALPFAVLKRRLMRRLEAMGVRVKQVRVRVGSFARARAMCLCCVQSRAAMLPWTPATPLARHLPVACASLAPLFTRVRDRCTSPSGPTSPWGARCRCAASP